MEVGDLVVVREGEDIPADLVLMAFSYPDANAYIQTSSLDGEKALKIKTAMQQT